MLEQQTGSKELNTFSCLPELATGSWLHTWSGWLEASGGQPGTGTHSPLAKEAQGLGTPALVQQQHWWWHVSPGAAHACGWRRERDKSWAGWARRTYSEAETGLCLDQPPEIWPFWWQEHLLALKMIKINGIIKKKKRQKKFTPFQLQIQLPKTNIRETKTSSWKMSPSVRCCCFIKTKQKT